MLMRLLTLFILPFAVFAVFFFHMFGMFGESGTRLSEAEAKIPFSHRQHIRVCGAEDCQICHSYTEEGRFTGLPKIKQCRVCHGADSLFDEYGDEDSPWPSRAGRPGLSFSHITVLSARFDDGRKKVTCVSCHGGKEDTEDSVKIRESLSMKECVSCHRALKLDTACMVCH